MKERSYLLYDFEPWKIFLHLPVFIISFLLIFPLNLLLKDIASIIANLIIVLVLLLFTFTSLNNFLFKKFTSNKLTIKTDNKFLDICIRKRAKEEVKLLIPIDSITKIETIYTSRDTHFKVYYGLDQIFTITRNDWFVFIKDDFNRFSIDIIQEIKARGLPIIK